MFSRFASYVIGSISYRLATRPSADLGASVGCLLGTVAGLTHGRTTADLEGNGHLWRPIVFGGGGGVVGALAGLYWPYVLTTVAVVDIVKSSSKNKKK
jgi:hypothetical protein